MTTMNEERAGFEDWLGITPKGAAHDPAYEAFRAGAAWQRAQGAVPDVSAMARVLSDRVASAYCADLDDNWKIYGQEYIEDVRAILAQPAQPTVQGEAVEVVAERITVVSITGIIQAVAATDYDSLKAERDRLQKELADLHSARSAQAERVEVVGYAGLNQLELHRLLPKYPGMKVKKEPNERYTEPLMTVAQHQRIMAAAVPAGCKAVPEGFKALLDRIVPRLDAGGPNPIDPEIHHCEWTLYQERERIHAEFAAAPAQGQQVEFGDAYQGAREDLAIWKRRALEAEEKLRQQGSIIDHLTLEAQGETRMGEPHIAQGQQVEWRTTAVMLEQANAGLAQLNGKLRAELSALKAQQVGQEQGEVQGLSAWIACCDDQLPPEDRQVLCWCDDGGMTFFEVASHHNGFFTDCFHELMPVTHWMPLPAAPEGGEV